MATRKPAPAKKAAAPKKAAAKKAAAPKKAAAKKIVIEEKKFTKEFINFTQLIVDKHKRELTPEEIKRVKSIVNK